MFYTHLHLTRFSGSSRNPHVGFVPLKQSTVAVFTYCNNQYATYAGLLTIIPKAKYWQDMLGFSSVLLFFSVVHLSADVQYTCPHLVACEVYG